MKWLYNKINFLILIFKEIFNREKKAIKIYDTPTTLLLIYENNMSVSRFGDGEFNLMFMEDLKFQRSNLKLREDLIRILNDESRNDKCLIGIPYTFATLKNVNLKSKWFWLQYYAKKRKNIMRILNSNIKYVDSQITRIYINRKSIDESQYFFSIWKRIWDKKDALLVEGELSRFGVGNDLLSNTKSLRRILCPAKDAYTHIHEIKKEILNHNDYNLIILVLGPTATVLAYDLSLLGIQVIDCGNMDMEYEWMKKKSKIPVALPEKYTLEAKNGEKVRSCDDELYQSQIIAKIGI